MKTLLLAPRFASTSIPTPFLLGVIAASFLLPSLSQGQSDYQMQGSMPSGGPYALNSPYASNGPSSYQAPAYKQPSYKQPSYQQPSYQQQSPYQQRGYNSQPAAPKAPKQTYSPGAYDQMQPYSYPAGNQNSPPNRQPQGPSYQYAPKPTGNRSTSRSVSQSNNGSLSQEVAELKAGQRRLDRRLDALESGSGGSSKSGNYVPSTPSGGKYRQHVVEYGDSLQDLATRYGVTVTQIKAANHLNSNLLTEGDVLKIPAKTTSKGSDNFVSTRGNGVHVVQRGESLSQIAGQYGLSSSALQKANGIRNPDLLVVGQKLMLPGRAGKGNVGSDTTRKTTIASSSSGKKSADRYVTKSSSKPKSTTLFADSSPPPPGSGLGSGAIPAPTGARGITSYRVEPGDSLESVARMFGTSAYEIQRKNKLASSKLPPVGDEIVVPQPGSVSS
ncbi:MAG: peptidoglycan-binding protein [Verrucomicrobiaceae bacterium]|nr:peptidoglycan-binding protein [Verrucomicrobiaceae bacterium]